MNDPPIYITDPPDEIVANSKMEFENFQAVPSPAVFVDVIEEPVFTPAESRSHRRKAKRSRTEHDRSRSRSALSSNVIEDVPLQAGQVTPSNLSLIVTNSKPSEISLPASLPSGPTLPQTATTSFEPVGRKLYSLLDKGPFTVHVQRIEATQSTGSTLHPVTFGRFLFDRSREFNGVKEGTVKSVGRNCISIDFVTADAANDFIQSPTLPNNNYKGFIPSFNVTRMGIVRGIPIDIDAKELMDNLKVPQGSGSVIKVRRLNFKVLLDGIPTWKPTQTVVLTFDGQVLPEHIFLCYNAFRVELYTYPTIQCFNCCRFGHTKTQCRSKPRCFKCTQDHTGDSCTIEEDRATCISCQGHHFATSKSCPEFQRQQDIKKTMSEKCISYAEASQTTAPSKKSYANVAASFAPAPLLSLPSQSQSSYKKTIPRRSRSPPPQTVGYDREAHNNIIREDRSEGASNGCALNNPLSEILSNQNLISELIKVLNLIVNLFRNFSSTSSPNQPSNVASTLSSLINLFTSPSVSSNSI